MSFVEDLKWCNSLKVSSDCKDSIHQVVVHANTINPKKKNCVKILKELKSLKSGAEIQKAFNKFHLG